MPICDWVECGSAWETVGCNHQYHQRAPRAGIVIQACNPGSSGDRGRSIGVKSLSGLQNKFRVDRGNLVSPWLRKVKESCGLGLVVIVLVCHGFNPQKHKLLEYVRTQGAEGSS